MDSGGIHPDPQRVADWLIGSRVDRFVVRRKLAEGGMGAVYLAEHERFENIKKVIKILLPEYAGNAMVRQRFEREAEAASRLKHHNILTIDSFGTLDDGQLFLMIPFLEGQPLDAYLAENGGRLAMHRALHIVLQLCSALQHAHDAGIVHRDLKPGNVFITPTSNDPYKVKLLDFGIAKVRGAQGGLSNTCAGMAIGTPSYMAVEQYEHADEATHLADVYALAIMAHEMLTGCLPWGRHDSSVLYFKQRTEMPQCPPEMSPEWYEVIRASLAADPRHRPQSMRDFGVALASRTPAIPPYVPSGAQILEATAREFLRMAPGDETVRNRSDLERVHAGPWRRETDASAQLPLHAVTSNVPALSARNERPDAGLASPVTTLSSSVGVSVVPATMSRWKLAIVGASVCVLTGVVTFALVSMHRTATVDAAARLPVAPATVSPNVDTRGAVVAAAAERTRASLTPPDAGGPAGPPPVAQPQHAPPPVVTLQVREPPPAVKSPAAESPLVGEHPVAMSMPRHKEISKIVKPTPATTVAEINPALEPPSPEPPSPEQPQTVAPSGISGAALSKLYYEVGSEVMSLPADAGALKQDYTRLNLNKTLITNSQAERDKLAATLLDLRQAAQLHQK